jgi:hypothetical protein
MGNIARIECEAMFGIWKIPLDNTTVFLYREFNALNTPQSYPKA